MSIFYTHDSQSKTCSISSASDWDRRRSSHSFKEKELLFPHARKKGVFFSRGGQYSLPSPLLLWPLCQYCRFLSFGAQPPVSSSSLFLLFLFLGLVSISHFLFPPWPSDGLCLSPESSSIPNHFLLLSSLFPFLSQLTFLSTFSLSLVPRSVICPPPVGSLSSSVNQRRCSFNKGACGLVNANAQQTKRGGTQELWQENKGERERNQECHLEDKSLYRNSFSPGCAECPNWYLS